MKPRQHLLLILDNCEHLVAACATLAADILRNCPSVHILASSREPLNVPGEQTYRVPSLSLPDPKQAQTAVSLSQYEAVRLFIERAQAVQPSFSVTNANAPALAQVCFRLDGIPLAIELAAARVRSLSVEEVNTRLDQRFRLLTGGARTVLPRQQTLRALIDWSYDLLTEAEKALLRRLSVFAGGWSLAAAEVVCAGGDVEDFEVLDLLTALVDKSLVVAEPQGEGTRYRLLETVRQYAGDRLGERSEAERLRDAHLSWCVALAEEAEPQLTGPEQGTWLSRLELEHDNLRASLSWYLFPEKGFASDAGLRLAGLLWLFWYVRGHLSEGRRWLTLALASGGEASAARAEALNGAGVLALGQGDFVGSRALLEESLTLSRQWGNQWGIAHALSWLGIVAQEQGDPEGARASLEESLALSRQLGNPQSIADSLGNLGNLAWIQGDYVMARTLLDESLSLYLQLGNPQGIADTLRNLGWVALNQGDNFGSRALYEESLTLYRQLGNRQGIAETLKNLGNVAHSQGDPAGARALYDESLSLFRQLGNQVGIADTLMNLGNVAAAQVDYAGARAIYEECLTLYRQMGGPRGIAFALGGLGIVANDQGDYAGACALLKESLTLFRQLGDQPGIAETLRNLGFLAHQQSQRGRAARLIGAAASLREIIGTPLNPMDQEDEATMLASARAALGEAAFSAAWDAGRAMTLDESVEHALREGDDD